MKAKKKAKKAAGRKVKITKKAPEKKEKKPAAPKRPKKLIVGNWKMNPVTLKEAKVILDKIKRGIPKKHNAKIVMCPPVAFFSTLFSPKIKAFQFGVQDISHFEGGSHTGEISAATAKSLGAQYAIIGHSERRKEDSGIAETDEMVAEKIRLAFLAKLTPIVCIGEWERDDHGMFLGLLKKQILSSLAGVPRTSIQEIIFAYEPAWAIGGSAALDPHDIHQMVLYVRKVLSDHYGESYVENVQVLYGGAVNETTSAAILSVDAVSGLLIGRASYNPPALISIIRTA